MTLFHDAFYRFVRLDAPEAVAEALRERAPPLLGSILVAPEGLNAMLAGTADELDAFQHALAYDPRLAGLFTGLDVKRSPCTTPPFARLKVHVKPEIVPLGIAGVDACGAIGTVVSPAQWRDLLADPGVLVIDNRNHFEFRLGRFKGAVNPHVNHFRDFPAYVLAHLDDWRAAHQRVAMYCTGGIRCEKSGAWMHALGLPVYQLDGGILNYFRAMPDGGDGLWEGECFVFDNRVALDARLQETATTLDDVYDADLDGAWRVRRARLLDAAA